MSATDFDGESRSKGQRRGDDETDLSNGKGSLAQLANSRARLGLHSSSSQDSWNVLRSKIDIMQAARGFALRRLSQSAGQGLQKRNMSGGHSAEENFKEMNKWRIVTYAAVPVCIGMMIYDFSGEHEHHHADGPKYSFMKIQSKEFPWGECALFDRDCWKQKALEAAGDSEE